MIKILYGNMMEGTADSIRTMEPERNIKKLLNSNCKDTKKKWLEQVFGMVYFVDYQVFK